MNEKEYDVICLDHLLLFLDKKMAYIIDLLDDSPLCDPEKWMREEVWMRHEREIRAEGGFMDDE